MRIIAKFGQTNITQTELIVEIIRTLEQARDSAVEVGSFNVIYMAELALFEANHLLSRFGGGEPKADKSKSHPDRLQTI
jgi:hypothetical protein